MALRNNLQDQLNYLTDHLSECQFQGFQYAPTASTDITVPTVFCFDTLQSNNSKSSSVQSVSSAGFLDLQTFRAEGNVRSNPAASPFASHVPTFRTEGAQGSAHSKYAAVVPEPPRRVEDLSSLVNHNIYDQNNNQHSNNSYNDGIIPSNNNNHRAATTSATVLNIQDEISRFESAIPDSALMEIDIDALVEAELAKSTQKAAHLPSSTSNGGGYGSTARPVDRAYSVQNTYTGQASAYATYAAPTSSRSDSIASDLSPVSTITHSNYSDINTARQAQQYTAGASASSGTAASAGVRSEGIYSSGGEINGANIIGTSNSASREAESQRLQREKDRLVAELAAVNAQLAEALQSTGCYPIPLKRQRAALEEQAEKVALQQHRLLQNSAVSTGTGSGSAGSTKENQQTYTNNAPVSGGNAGGVIDLCSAAKSTTYGNYAAPYSVTSSTNSYYNGGSGCGVGVGAGSSNSQLLSPQLAAVSRLATSGDTPVAVNTYRNTNNNTYNNRTSGAGSSSSFPDYGAGYGNSGTAFNTARSTYGANGNGGSNNGTAGFVAHSLNTAHTALDAPVLKKTSAFTRDAFDPEFEDAVNDNDFTDWAVGAPTQENNVAYRGFGHADAGDGDYGGSGGGGGMYNINTYTNTYNTNNNRSTTHNVDMPLCNCGNPTILCTSRSEASSGLKFFSCAGARGTDAHCGFFQWEDPASAPNNNSSMYNNNVHSSGGGSAGAVKDHMHEIQERFGHVGFRQGQLGCVEAALSGRDVFCLMPTGGGKSVVYQLPAWCSPGVAVIFSPLISLIQDQVDSMNAIGIRAVFMSSMQDNEEVQSVVQELGSYCYSSYTNYNANSITDDEARIKMLYITPEKFSQSEQLKRLLTKLANNSLLSRFIIDEAHCLSQWGHDFRPDYLKLSQIRSLYPKVPLMALTATANNSVVQDCMRILQMKDPYLHSQSFNRSNLRYSIRRKESDKKTVQEIGDFVLKHRKQSGIIYCLSRKDTQSMAEELQKVIPSMRREITFYHADLPASEKESRQRAWSKGDVKLICATIAFGMGINKPDVRYVIHHSLPKSLTNYYQESGRAGRDGETSHCVLYYSFKDRTKLAHMIHKSAEDRGRTAGSHDNIRRQLENLNKCVQYCIDEVQCRRVMLLEYFGETFPRAQCDGTCDNCKHYKDTSTAPPPPQDLTIHAKALLHLCRATTDSGQRLTLIKLARYYGRSKDKESAKTAAILDKIDLSKVPELAAAAVPLTLKHDLTERLLQHMVIEDYLQEIHIANFGNYGADYISEGVKGKELLKPVTPMGRYGYASTVQSNVQVLLPTQRTRQNDGIEGMLPAPPPPKPDKPAKKARKSKGDGEPAKAAKGSKATASSAPAAPAPKSRAKKGAGPPVAQAPQVSLQTAASARAAQSVQLEDSEGEWHETQRPSAAVPRATTTAALGKGATVRALPATVAATAAVGGKGKKPAASSKPIAPPALPSSSMEPVELFDSDEDKPLSTLKARKNNLTATAVHTTATSAGVSAGGKKKFSVPYAQPPRPPSPEYDSIGSDSDTSRVRGRGGGKASGAKSAARSSAVLDSETASEGESVNEDIYSVDDSDSNDGDQGGQGSSNSSHGAGMFDRRTANLETRKGPASGSKSAAPTGSATKRRQSTIDMCSSSSSEESDASEESPTDAGGTSLVSQVPGTTSSGAAGGSCLLSKRQQAAFKQWLEEYRKKWVAYWNYLSNAVVTHIITKVPVTGAELALIPGFGASKARLHGEGILATIYAFLETQDALHLFPHASPPTLPECPTWRNPFSEEAEIIRTHQIENGPAAAAAQGNQRRISYSQTQAPFNYEGSPAPGQRENDGDSIVDGSPPMIPPNGGGVGHGVAPLPYTATFKPQPAAPSGYNAVGMAKAAPIDVVSGQKASYGGHSPPTVSSYHHHSAGPAGGLKRPLYPPYAQPGGGAESNGQPAGANAYSRPAYNAPPNMPHIQQGRPPSGHTAGSTNNNAAAAGYGNFRSATALTGEAGGAGAGGGAGGGATFCAGDSGGSEESQSKKARVQPQLHQYQGYQQQQSWGGGDDEHEHDYHSATDYLG